MSLHLASLRAASKAQKRKSTHRTKKSAAQWRQRRDANLKADGIVVPLSEWLGHNNGPPLFDSVAYLKWVWAKAIGKAWEPPTPEIGLRWAHKAAELGVSYQTYVLEILERGHHLTADDLQHTTCE